MSFSLIYCHFAVLRTIKSLPVWHGARWTALFRNAAHHALVNPEEAFAGLMSERSGTTPLQLGEKIVLRLIFSSKTWAATRAMLHSLHRGFPSEGEFQAGESVAFYGTSFMMNVETTPWDNFLPQPMEISPELIHRLYPFSHKQPLRVHLLGPLRLTMPAGKKADARFATPQFMQNEMESASCFLSRLRLPANWPPYICAPTRITLNDTDVRWEDLGYNANRRIRLGGLVGSFTLNGVSNPTLYCAIMAGQYFGAGKNGRFGFGYYAVSAL